MNIVWLRNDLRLDDNAPLYEGSKGPMIIAYIWDPEHNAHYPLGSASKWWLHQSLTSLQKDLQNLGHKLHFFIGNTANILSELALQNQAEAVYTSRNYDPLSLEQEESVKQALTKNKINYRVYNTHLLFDPNSIKNKEGNVFKVFTPFWKTILNQSFKPFSLSPAPLPYNKNDTEPQAQKAVSLETIPLLPHGYDWSQKLEKHWSPGEASAKEKLTALITLKLKNYSVGRDFPELNSTSQLSPHLCFGEISPRTIWNTVLAYHQQNPQDDNALKFLSELSWREFAHYTLYHKPTLISEPFKSSFQHFPYLNNPEQLHAWQKGLTGYPLIDAGMRELWATGTMHNRVRMATASFLTKHLLLSWKDGAAWFWDTLVDADIASNTFSWQWVAGCGCDAAPYFRIFNPTTQAIKFDPNGLYIRKWLPELAHLPISTIHEPWKFPNNDQYPSPIIDHTFARNRALEALKNIG